MHLETGTLLWDTRLHGAPLPGVLHAPVMRVAPLTEGMDNFMAHYATRPLPLIISSQTTLRLLAAIPHQHPMTLITTGSATAHRATKLGLTVIDASRETGLGEGIRAVAAYIKEQRIPACYYPAAEQTAFDIAQLEAWSGAEVKPFPCYRTVMADALPAELSERWGEIGGVVAGSLRTAQAIAVLVGAAGLSAKGKTAFCRNADIAACLRERLDMEAFHHDGRGTGEDAFDAWLAQGWQQRATLKAGKVW